MSFSKLKSKKKKLKDPLFDRIESFLEARVNKPLPYKQKPGHKPSSLGTHCLRRIYYSYYRTERDSPINAFLARIFDTGNYYEDMVLSWLKEMGEHIPYRNKDGEIPKGFGGKGENAQFPIVMTDWRIPKGFIDNVAFIDGELWLYEIKSKNSDKFDALTSPDTDHMVQISCYFKAFNDHLAAGDYEHIEELKNVPSIAGVKVIYVNKNNSNLKVFSVELDDLVDQIIDLDVKLEEVNTYIDAVELPPMTKGDCKYCDFKAKCKKNQNVEAP